MRALRHRLLVAPRERLRCECGRPLVSCFPCVTTPSLEVPRENTRTGGVFASVSCRQEGNTPQGAFMILCASGDIHGSLTRWEIILLAFEKKLGVRFDYVLNVGDVGIWPDPKHIDKATRNHGGPGDFQSWYDGGHPFPRDTVFVKGNHEDFDWLHARQEAGTLEILPRFHYLPNGERTHLGTPSGESVTVGGIGGCYGPSDYSRKTLQGWARRHFTQDEVDHLIEQGPLDILLLHDAPAGVEFFWKHKDGSVRRRYTSEAEGLRRALTETRPSLCLFGHHHTRLDASVNGIPCLGLNKSPYPGNLVALEIEGRQCRVLGEW